MNINYEISFDNVTLKPLDKSNLECLRKWRNNSENNIYLRDIGEITTEQQINWYETYVLNLNEVYFSIYETKSLNKLVGVVSLYDINNESAEIGRILIGEKEAHGLGIGKRSLVMLMKFSFEILKLKTIKGTVNKNNVAAIINDVAIGFKIIGEQDSSSKVGGKDFLLDIDYDRLKAVNNYIESIEVKEV